jgi:DNA-binding HxlR family transcriptional regulator
MPLQSRAPASLSTLFHHRWFVPILVELAQSEGAKFVTLKHRLGISRDSLQRTLRALIKSRLVMRNPGYGHPLRPEYILTPRGQQLARRGAPVVTLLRRLDLEQIGLKKWCMPLLAALESGSSRFSEIKNALPGVTGRALTLALKELKTAGLIVRNVIDSYPPIAHYKLTAAARPLIRVLGPMRELLKPAVEDRRVS